MKQYGAVVTFPLGTTKEQANLILSKLLEETEGITGTEPFVSGPYDFNPDWGGPVWYIP